MLKGENRGKFSMDAAIIRRVPERFGINLLTENALSAALSCWSAVPKAQIMFAPMKNVGIKSSRLGGYVNGTISRNNNLCS